MSYSSFWSEFSQMAPSWAAAFRLGDHRGVLDAIDNMLQCHGLNLCFDITADPKGCVLIFSPEGRLDIANSIDKLVEKAPHISGWRFLPRRPRKDLNDAASIIRQLYVIDPLSIRFRIHETKNGHLVDMIVPVATDLSTEEAIGFANTFLWHAIGEDRVMDRNIQGHVCFDDTPAGATISATQLVEALG